MDSCIFCENLVPSNEANVKITERGINSLLEAAEDRNDAIAQKLFFINDNNGWVSMKFHKNCRSTYIDKKKRESFKRQMSEHDTLGPSKICRNNNNTYFDWNNSCFICGKGDYKRKGYELTLVLLKPEEIRNRILHSSAVSEECNNRLITQSDLLSVKAKYHKACYALHFKDSEKIMSDLLKKKIIRICC